MEKKKRVYKKRIVPFLNYIVRDFSDYDKIAQTPELKNIIFTNLFEAIKYSASNKKNTADIVMLNHEEYIVLNKDKWKNSLEKAIEFFSSDEVQDYEKCKECKDLINNL